MATLAVAFFSLAPFAIGSPPQPLTRIGSEASSAAGGIGNPRGVAADPATGQIFIADLSNSRIDEFTPWGSFVKAFGWDVAPGAVDEEQEVRLRATAGQFKLSFEASTTPSLPFNATAIEVQSALNALSSISVGGGSVIVEGGPGGLPGSTPSVYVVRFSGGALAGTNVSSLVATSGITPLSGGSPVTLLAVATRADGIGGGTGLESCTSTSGCKAGLQGSGPGEFHEPVGVTVDASGNIYVFDYRNLRVQKFDSAGRFLLMFGGEVNKTTGEDVCTSAQLEEGNICGVGVTGTGSGHFGLKEVIGGFGNYIAAAPSGSIYVGDKDRI